MSDQWTDNPDVASQDAPEALPDDATQGSLEERPVAEGLDAALDADPADEQVADEAAALPADVADDAETVTDDPTVDEDGDAEPAADTPTADEDGDR